MPEPQRRPHAPRPQETPEKVVGAAIQDLMARRLGRGFVPLALVFLAGLARALDATPWSPWTLTLSLGALAAGAAMLAHGLRVVQRAFGRPHRRWMSWAAAGSVLPPVFALYVLGWRGLRPLFSGGGAASVLAALLFTAMWVWIMRAWMKVVEVERLARAMSGSADETGGGA